ncbi:MAG: hypothetical protein Q4C04_01260 [Clostridia bacterium]|nr:hypothetical protein [Clostridia bacterium]
MTCYGVSTKEVIRNCLYYYSDYTFNDQSTTPFWIHTVDYANYGDTYHHSDYIIGTRINANTLGAQAWTVTGEKIRFGATIGVRELKAMLAVGESFNYGFRAQINGESVPVMTGANNDSIAFYGSSGATSTARNDVIWTDAMESAADAAALVTLLREAGFKVYANDDTTITFVLIIDGVSEAQDMNFAFRPFLSVNGTEEYLHGTQMYNSVTNILAGVGSTITTGQ